MRNQSTRHMSDFSIHFSDCSFFKSDDKRYYSCLLLKILRPPATHFVFVLSSLNLTAVTHGFICYHFVWFYVSKLWKKKCCADWVQVATFYLSILHKMRIDFWHLCRVFQAQHRSIHTIRYSNSSLGGLVYEWYLM